MLLLFKTAKKNGLEMKKGIIPQQFTVSFPIKGTFFIKNLAPLAQRPKAAGVISEIARVLQTNLS